jgi:hypothetical protein
MAKIEKLVERLFSCQADFTWKEFVRVLAHFGYREVKTGKTAGSRRKFADGTHDELRCHKPHPSNIMKRYVSDQFLNIQKQEVRLKNE